MARKRMLGLLMIDGLAFDDWLGREYATRTMRDIASQLGVVPSAILLHLRRLGIETRAAHVRSGEHHFRHQGYRIASEGYVEILCPNHPQATSNGYVREHRLVMEQVSGRFLEPWEVVHHKNGNKADNRPENLEVMTQSEHMKLHRREQGSA